MHTCAFTHKGVVKMQNASTALATTLLMQSHFVFSRVMRKTEKRVMARKTEDAPLRLKLMTISKNENAK
jgi:hypothetical protein